MADMDLRQINQFVLLAETLHFGRASEAAHLSVSALSRNIRQLEDELGVTLFHRDNRSVALTHEGALFLDYARSTLGDWDIIRNTLLEEASELHGQISIWCSVTASYSFLFELLSEFRRNHRHVEIKLHTGDPEHAVNRVLNGSEDISIGARPESLPAALDFRPIATTPLVFITAAANTEFPKPGSAGFKRTDWNDVPMILSETGLARRRIDSWMQDRGVSPSIYAQVAGNEAIVSMVSLGFGVGVVPQIVLENSPLAATVEILPVRPALKPYEVGLFTLKRKLRNPLIKAFWSEAG